MKFKTTLLILLALVSRPSFGAEAPLPFKCNTISVRDGNSITDLSGIETQLVRIEEGYGQAFYNVDPTNNCDTFLNLSYILGYLSENRTVVLAAVEGSALDLKLGEIDGSKYLLADSLPGAHTHALYVYEFVGNFNLALVHGFPIYSDVGPAIMDGNKISTLNTGYEPGRDFVRVHREYEIVDDVLRLTNETKSYGD
jgi:hypothetical protein